MSKRGSINTLKKKRKKAGFLLMLMNKMTRLVPVEQLKGYNGRRRKNRINRRWRQNVERDHIC